MVCEVGRVELEEEEEGAVMDGFGMVEFIIVLDVRGNEFVVGAGMGGKVGFEEVLAMDMEANGFELVVLEDVVGGIGGGGLGGIGNDVEGGTLTGGVAFSLGAPPKRNPPNGLVTLAEGFVGLGTVDAVVDAVVIFWAHFPLPLTLIMRRFRMVLLSAFMIPYFVSVSVCPRFFPMMVLELEWKCSMYKLMVFGIFNFEKYLGSIKKRDNLSGKIDTGLPFLNF